MKMPTRRLSGSLALASFIAILAAVGVAGSAAKKPAAPLGLPAHSSLLFTLNAKAGTMHPAKGAAGEGHYRLDLTGVDDRTVWFADRPRRDAGRLRTDRFFGGWGSLGFRADPPNAALVARVGGRTRTVAVELKLRRYSRRDRSAAFDARVLGSLGQGLDHLNDSLDAPPVGEFRAPTLFLDNGGSERTCTLGETRLMPISPASRAALPGMIPAEGQSLRIAGNYVPLFTIIGTTYGGNGSTTFAVPKLASPAAGTTWFICAEGIYPQGETLTSSCTVGETDFWARPNGIGGVTQWAPADGRKVSVEAFPEYARRFASPGAGEVALPSVTAPAGMTALTCLYSPEGEPAPILGQLDLLPSLQADQTSRSIPALGQAVSQTTPLGALLAGNQVLKGNAPSLSPAGPGANWYLASEGSWPLG